MSSTLEVIYDGRTIVPSPIISIDKEFIYANYAIIGYTYIINLNGFASSFNKQLNNTTSNLVNTVLSLKDIQDTLHRNGKKLLVKCGDTILIEGNGGQLRSFNTDDTENKWFNYAKFSAAIEFSDVYFGSNFNTDISNDSITGGGAGGLTPELLRIKSYNDNWNFAIAEEDMYAYYSRITADNIRSTEDYTKINVQYTINAVGKHHYDSSGNLIPAWERAKNFVQEKLWNQISIFRTNGPLGAAIFNNTNYNSTDIPNDLSNTLNNSHSSSASVASTPLILPILHNSIGAQYKIYNEIITCSASESDGGFTATYKCILKRYSNPSIFPQDSIHSFTVSYDQTRDFNSSNRVISVNGTLQGLIPTNILAPSTYGGGVVESTGQVFSLPSNGIFIDTFNSSEVSKYTYALRDFITYIGKRSSYNVFSADDLSDAFKRVLSINYANLFPNTEPNALQNCVDGSARLSSILALPQSFNVSHNYGDGSISYTAEYSTERSCAMERGFETFSVTENDATPSYAEFTIPGRAAGPLIQDLNTHSSKTITFDFDGTTKKGCVAGTPFSIDYSGAFLDVCSTDDYVNIPQPVLCMIFDTEARHPELIPKNYSVSYSPIDGSYKLSKTYIVCNTGDTSECDN